MSEYVSTLTISDARLHYDIILKTAKRHRAAEGPLLAVDSTGRCNTLDFV
jgi:hypothetical protein